MFMVDFFLNKESFVHLYIYIYRIYTITYYIPACKKLTSYKRSEIFSTILQLLVYVMRMNHIMSNILLVIQFLK
jgi:hypothetical protein